MDVLQLKLAPFMRTQSEALTADCRIVRYCCGRLSGGPASAAWAVLVNIVARWSLPNYRSLAVTVAVAHVSAPQLEFSAAAALALPWARRSRSQGCKHAQRLLDKRPPLLLQPSLIPSVTSPACSPAAGRLRQPVGYPRSVRSDRSCCCSMTAVRSFSRSK